MSNYGCHPGVERMERSEVSEAIGFRSCPETMLTVNDVIVIGRDLINRSDVTSDLPSG